MGLPEGSSIKILRAAGSAHNRVAEPQAGRAEPGYLAGDVVHDELKPIPSAWNGLSAVGHWSSRRTGRAA